MNFRSRLGLPAMTLAAAAILAACGGGSNASPVPVPTSTPPPATAWNLEARVSVECSSVDGKAAVAHYGQQLWEKLVGTHLSEYSLRVAGAALSDSECVSPVNSNGISFAPVYNRVDQLVFAFSQDKSGAFPAELTVLSAVNGDEVGYVMHPGHLKGVAPLGKMNTPNGSRDIVVVIGVSNISSLVQQASEATGKRQPYVPFAMAIDVSDVSTMAVLGYLPLGDEGQPLFPTVSVGSDGGFVINYKLRVKGEETPASFPVSRLFGTGPSKLAGWLTAAGFFR